MFSKETYIKRRELLRERVSRGGLILLPGNSEAPRNYPDNGYHYRQDSNFLYFYGLKLPDLVGLLDIDAGEDGSSATTCRWTTSSGRDRSRP